VDESAIPFEERPRLLDYTRGLTEAQRQRLDALLAATWASPSSAERVDEASRSAAENLDELERENTRAERRRGTYAVRPRKGCSGRQRGG
jgi:hypothetical protein